MLFSLNSEISLLLSVYCIHSWRCLRLRIRIVFICHYCPCLRWMV